MALLKTLLLASLTLVIPSHLSIAAEAKKGPEQWDGAIAAFEKQDKTMPPAKGGIVAVGSSSIRLWKLDKSFPALDITNRGFGGSHVADSVHFAQRIVTPYKPHTVVIYAGDNDVAAGKSPEEVAADFRKFVEVIRDELPDARIIYIAIKPSIKRVKLMDTARKTNRIIEEYCKSVKGLVYLDVFTPMLNSEGQPRPELFVEDGLHLNEEGYKLWSSLLRPHLARPH